MTVAPGAFRVRNDPPNPNLRVAIEVAYTEFADLAAIRKELNEAHRAAVAEVERRFAGTRDDRRHRPAATR